MTPSWGTHTHIWDVFTSPFGERGSDESVLENDKHVRPLMRVCECSTPCKRWVQATMLGTNSSNLYNRFNIKSLQRTPFEARLKLFQLIPMSALTNAKPVRQTGLLVTINRLSLTLSVLRLVLLFARIQTHLGTFTWVFLYFWLLYFCSSTT